MVQDLVIEVLEVHAEVTHMPLLNPLEALVCGPAHALGAAAIAGIPFQLGRTILDEPL
jgi:hypothetical protein